VKEVKIEVVKMEKLVIGKKDLNEENFYTEQNIDFDGAVEFEAGLGRVKIAGQIRATRYIFAGAGTGIKAGEGIEAGLSIVCKTLNAKLRIFAGLCIWRMPNAEEMQIRCERLESGEICYGELVKEK